MAASLNLGAPRLLVLHICFEHLLWRCNRGHLDKGKCQKIPEVCCRLLRTIPRTRPLSPVKCPPSRMTHRILPPPVCTDHHYHMQGRTQTEDTRGEKAEIKERGTVSRNLDHEWLCVWRGEVVGGMFCPVRTGTSSPGTPSWPLGPALCSRLLTSRRQPGAGSLSTQRWPLLLQNRLPVPTYSPVVASIATYLQFCRSRRGQAEVSCRQVTPLLLPISSQHLP